MEKGGRGSCSLPNTFPIGSPQKAPSLSLPPPYHQNQASLLHRIRSQCLSTRTRRVFSSQTFCPLFLPSPILPILQLQERAPSVLIVGGGVMGLGSALHLAEAGCTVTVLEKEESVAKAGTRGHKQRTEHTNAIPPVKGRWPPTSTVRCSVLRSARPGPASNFYQR